MFYRKDLHLSPRGHEIVGQALVERMRLAPELSAPVQAR